MLITGHAKEKKEIIDKMSFNNLILQPVSLKNEKWALVYDSDDYDDANLLFELFLMASEKFGLLVEPPQWIELPKRSSASNFEQYINEDIDPKTHRAVLVLLPKFHYYAQVKRCLDRKGIISQIVLKNNVRKGAKSNNFGLSLASELLK